VFLVVVYCFEFRIYGLDGRIWCLVWCLGFEVWGLGFGA
jgi:hypothetical protein